MKIGFACKMSYLDDKNTIISEADLNTKITTVAWLKRQSKAVAEKRIEELVTHNLSSVHKLVERVGKQVESLRMVRISSDLLPVYTEPTFGYVYRSSTFRSYIESKFGVIGELARKNNVRLSFHPGQFCVLGSSNPDVVNRSIEDFEYHADMARWMGYGSTWHDHGFKINVHISGRSGPDGIISVLPRLSTEARNLITIENEEISYGLDDCLKLVKHVPIVLDLHHTWIHSGQYIQQNDPRIEMILESWRGVRPTLHYSISREDLLVGHCPNTMPDLNNLLAQGHKKQKLRAHSDYMWNTAVNEYARSHWKWADIMVECKSKNLGVDQLFEAWKQFKNSV
jgi:UV DNA damage repair endonuclease